MRRSTAVLRYRDGKTTSPENESDGRIRYGGRWVSAASALPLRESLAHVVATAVKRPRNLAALIALLVRTPREYIVLSSSSTGEALSAYFNQRSLGVLRAGRFCQGVLLLPSDHADYLRGRRRQALRTNLRKAANAGVRCELVSDPRRAADDISHVLGRQWGWLPAAELETRVNEIRASVTASEMTVAIARDEQGRPLAMAAAIIDDAVCLIKHAVSTTHEARWALHDHLVRFLIARGVRYLLATGGGRFGALGFTSSVQHYQHLLGYELRHVVPIAARRRTWRRRLVAAGVVVVATLAVAVPRAAASGPGPFASRDEPVRQGRHALPSRTERACRLPEATTRSSKSGKHL